MLMATGQVLFCALLQLWARSSLFIVQPLQLLTLISRDGFCCSSLGLRQGKPLTWGSTCIIL